MGDFNARTGNLTDPFLKYNDDSKTILDDITDHTEPETRFNTDSGTNSYGKELLNTCKNLDILIMNGRTEGNTPGKLTYHGPIGSSTIDYGLASANIAEQLLYFHVETPSIILFDHCLTQICLKLPWSSIKTQPHTNH